MSVLEEDILNQNRFFFNVRSDKYSFIDKEILYNKKRKSQTGHWADYSCISGVFGNKRDTDRWRNMMHN